MPAPPNRSDAEARLRALVKALPEGRLIEVEEADYDRSGAPLAWREVRREGPTARGARVASLPHAERAAAAFLVEAPALLQIVLAENE